MSETTETKTVTSTKAKGEIGPSMIGSEILVSALEREGVDTIFAYPGGASMEFHQALTRSEQIRTILPRHEQGGAFAAEGYARATGKAGVCMATSGPGATNLVTGIADAFMDSIPLVAITGQVPQAMIGKGGFQETDFFGMTLPVVKHSYLVTDVNEIPAVVKQAFKIATSGRPGPVVIDVPKNIQQTRAQVLFPDEVDIAGFDPEGLKASELELNEIVGLIEKSERPLLYVGGGIISADASDALRRLVAATGIPVTSTIMGVGAFPETHELSLRWLGMHGSAYANWAVSGEFEKDAEGNSTKVAEGADLLLAFGVRFDDRVTGKVEKFCEHGTIVHIDIDPSEINKNRKVALPVVSEIRYALEQLADMVSERPLQKKFTVWQKQIAEWKTKAPFGYRVTDEVLKSQHMKDHLDGSEDEVILPQMVIEMLYELTAGEAILTTGVGQHQMWASQYWNFEHPYTWINSGGLGTMGFSIPAAIGAKVGCPDRMVWAVDGDGCFQMTAQELVTSTVENIPIKVALLNNSYLGMVRQWQDMFYEERLSEVHLSQDVPDYKAWAESMGCVGMRVDSPEEVPAAIAKANEIDDRSVVIDFRVAADEKVFPMVPSGAANSDIVVPPSQEDQER